MTVKQLTAPELRNKIQSAPDVFLLDVREPGEFDIASIAGSVLIPLHQIPDRIAELDSKRETIVICHHGMRSQQAAHYLVQCGFNNVANLTGGIHAWSCLCDNSVPRY